MHERCRNAKHKSYKDYGDRGITVCERWNLFANFIEDMGLKPHPSLTIERVNNNAGYTPENCIWATKSQQARNRRKRKTKKSRQQSATA